MSELHDRELADLLEEQARKYARLKIRRLAKKHGFDDPFPVDGVVKAQPEPSPPPERRTIYVRSQG